MTDKSHIDVKTFTAPVIGGFLQGRVWGNQGPVVLCAHGITAAAAISQRPPCRTSVFMY